MFADVLNVEILILEQDGTVNMRGALKSAQGNLEEIELFHSAIRFTSKGNLREHYDRLYSGFVEAYPALKSIFSTLHQ
jgi:sugar (pentulose or hexulose) kinase